MATKKSYFVFHKEFYEIRKELGIKAWYELETYMLQLRFDGIDTDPQTIKNKSIKREWIMIRKKILDSIENMNRQNKHRENEKELVVSKTTIKDIKTTEFDLPNCQISNTSDLSPSNDEEVEQPQPIGDNATESLKIGKDDIKINLTEKEINEVMGTYKGTIEELNKRTIINDFSSIDRLVPKLNKEMVLKQVKPYLSKEKNIGRLNDALSIFLKDVSLDDRVKYYEFLLEQSFAVAS